MKFDYVTNFKHFFLILSKKGICILFELGFPSFWDIHVGPWGTGVNTSHMFTNVGQHYPDTCFFRSS